MKKLLRTLILLVATVGITYGQSSFLDPTFGVGGIVTTQFGTSTTNPIAWLAIQFDHKILTVIDGIKIVRYNENGSIDSSFGLNGVFFNSDIIESSLVILASGKILVEGNCYRTGTTHSVFLTMRLNSDGTVDTTFGIGGIAKTDFNTFDGDNGYRLAVQPDNKIVILGETSYSICIARLLPNGGIDSTFGTNGMSMPNPGGGILSDFALMADGRIVIGMESSDNLFLGIRLLSNGFIDTSFNHTGFAETLAGDTYNYCHGLALQANNKIVLGGGGTFGTTGSDFTLIRYNVDGSLDRTYGDTGVVNIDFNGDDEEIGGMCIDAEGRIIATGYTTVSGLYDFALVRIDSNGKVDSTFGNNGRIYTRIQDGNDAADAVVLQSGNKIIAGGYSILNSTHYTYASMACYAIPATIVPDITDNEDSVSLYPNPATNKIFVSNTSSHYISNLSAYDITGRQVDVQTTTFFSEIGIDKLESGVYFFRLIFDDGASVVKRIVISR